MNEDRTTMEATQISKDPAKRYTKDRYQKILKLLHDPLLWPTPHSESDETSSMAHDQKILGRFRRQGGAGEAEMTTDTYRACVNVDLYRECIELIHEVFPKAMFTTILV